MTEQPAAEKKPRLLVLISGGGSNLQSFIDACGNGSLQAQLVQPLAVTLIFGLLLSPFLVLFFVPALLGIGSDIRARFGAQRTAIRPAF